MIRRYDGMTVLEALKYLKEMSDGVYDIKQDLRSGKECRLVHLIILFLYRSDSNNIHHWCSEIHRSLHNTNKAKHNNKFLPYKDILECVWLNWEDTFLDQLHVYLDMVQEKEGKIIPEFDLDNLYSFLKDYYEWLSRKLSSTGKILMTETEDKLLSLLDRYPINDLTGQISMFDDDNFWR